MSASSISRRIESSIQAMNRKAYEDAFIHLFPAIDKTAKKRSRVGCAPRTLSLNIGKNRLPTLLSQTAQFAVLNRI